MHHAIFVNLPVQDQVASRDYFTHLGYTFNEEYCEEGKALCLVLGQNMYAMLLATDFFATFTDRPVADATATSQVLLCLDADSREGVDELVDKAVAAGGADVRTEDHGFMYGRSFADLDGHIWEIMWMDPAAMQGGPPQQD